MVHNSLITVCSTVLFFVHILGRTFRNKIQFFHPAPFTLNCSSPFRDTCAIARLETCTLGPLFRSYHKGIVIIELSASYRKSGSLMVPNQAFKVGVARVHSILVTASLVHRMTCRREVYWNRTGYKRAWISPHMLLGWWRFLRHKEIHVPEYGSHRLSCRRGSFDFLLPIKTCKVPLHRCLFIRFEAVHPYFIFRHDVSEKVIPFMFKPRQEFRRDAVVILLAWINQLPLDFPRSAIAPIFCTHLLPNCPVGMIIVSQLRFHLP